MVENTDEALLKLVGSRIKSLRKDRKFSLRDLAYKIGMEPSNLSVKPANLNVCAYFSYHWHSIKGYLRY